MKMNGVGNQKVKKFLNFDRLFYYINLMSNNSMIIDYENLHSHISCYILVL